MKRLEIKIHNYANEKQEEQFQIKKKSLCLQIGN